MYIHFDEKFQNQTNRIFSMYVKSLMTINKMYIHLDDEF